MAHRRVTLWSMPLPEDCYVAQSYTPPGCSQWPWKDRGTKVLLLCLNSKLRRVLSVLKLPVGLDEPSVAQHCSSVSPLTQPSFPSLFTVVPKRTPKLATCKSQISDSTFSESWPMSRCFKRCDYRQVWLWTDTHRVSTSLTRGIWQEDSSRIMMGKKIICVFFSPLY